MAGSGIRTLEPYSGSPHVVPGYQVPGSPATVAYAVFAVTEDSISIEEKKASIRQNFSLNNSKSTFYINFRLLR